MNGTLVDIALRNLMALLPFVMIKSYQAGIRWSWFGKTPAEIKPGIRWKIWFFHHVDIYDIVDDVIDLPTQSIITQDGKLVCFAVNVGYRINDVVAHGCNVMDFRESTAGLAMTHLAQRVRAMSYDDLVSPEGLKKLETSLEGTLTTRFKRWGTEVFSVGFTTFSPVPLQARIFLDSHRNTHSLSRPGDLLVE